MEIIIVTGLSGAGKSRTVDALEDIGFFCVDNLPPKLISRFVELALQSEDKLSKIAIVTDVRGKELFNDLNAEIDMLKENKIYYKILFLDCKDEELVRRYKETRRLHPLVNNENMSIEKAIEAEREILSKVKGRANYVIDTTILPAMQLKERICSIFLDNVANSMLINCMSFGFKYGSPSEADLVFDVRCLPNPFYISALKRKTGLDSDVNEYVMSWPQSEQLLEKLKDLIDFLIPLYLSEGKSQLTIAIGCTGGKHRSVTFAEKIYTHMNENEKRCAVNHRDILK